MIDPVAIREVSGRGVHVPGDDIDTDRIIPARFLKLLSFRGLGRYAFFDARFEADGTPKAHPLNDPRFEGASILLSDRNFGCGSSREHAPQSLYRGGFRAIVAESFAEIFFGNAIALGLVCATASSATIGALARAIDGEPATAIAVDVDGREIRAGGARYELEIPDSAREALLSGQWDPLQQLVARADEVRAVYERLPYTRW